MQITSLHFNYASKLFVRNFYSPHLMVQFFFFSYFFLLFPFSLANPPGHANIPLRVQWLAGRFSRAGDTADPNFPGLLVLFQRTILFSVFWSRFTELLKNKSGVSDNKKYILSFCSVFPPLRDWSFQK